MVDCQKRTTDGLHMIIEHHEKVISNFEGTIIDIETIGEFNRLYKHDSRQYKEIVQVILGYMTLELGWTPSLGQDRGFIKIGSHCP